MKNSENKSAQELLKIIKGKGISDAQIASMLGVSTKTISNWESGAFSPRPDKLQKLQEMAESPNLTPAKTERYDVGEAVRRMEAIAEVTLSAVAELLARSTGQSSTVVQEQLEDLVNKRLGSS